MGCDRAADASIYAMWQMYAGDDGVRFGSCDPPLHRWCGV